MTSAERAADRSPLLQRSRTRSIERAQLIVEAARRLIGEKGTGFTTQELAREAGVTLHTFYRHFTGKDELLLAVLEEAVAESCAGYRERAAGLPDPLSRLHLYITTAVAAVDGDDAAGRRFMTAEHYRLHQLFPTELAEADRPFSDLIIPEIVEATELGLLHPSDVERDAWMVTQLVMATFHHYAFAPRAEPIEALSESVWRFCVSALGGDPDRQVVSG